MIARPFNLNPLNCSGIRQLDHCPPHFFAVDFEISTNEKRLTDWIWVNLQGRFFFGDAYVINTESKNKFASLRKRAAFEIHSESSYFAMLLPDLNKF